MPFKSKAQMRKMGELVQEGKVSQKTFDEWSSKTKYTKLPEKLTPKTKLQKVKTIK